MQNRVSQVVDECHRQESNFHLVNSKRQIAAAQIRRGELGTLTHDLTYSTRHHAPP